MWQRNYDMSSQFDNKIASQVFLYQFGVWSELLDFFVDAPSYHNNVPLGFLACPAKNKHPVW